MSESNLQIVFNNSSGLIEDPYWLHMEVKEDDISDGMTVAEAAKMIDAAYNVDPCGPSEQEDTWKQTQSQTNMDIWNASDFQDMDEGILSAFNRFSNHLSAEGYLDLCNASSVNEFIEYDVTIKVFRSHREELYKLQISNGLVRSKIHIEDRVSHTVDIDGQKSYTFDNPILRRPVIKWQGFDGPEIHIIGNTVYWDGIVKGTLYAEFDTEWDEVSIHVTADPEDSSMITGTDFTVSGTGWYTGSEIGEEIDDYQDIECSVLGFYHYQYEELVLTNPEEESSSVDKDNICFSTTTILEGSTGDGESETDTDEDLPMCRQHVNEYTICQCDGKESHSSYYKEVPCTYGANPGSTLSGSQELKTYKDCGYRDEANDPEVYLEKCCEEWPFEDKSMPLCKKSVSRFIGENEKNFKESDYPEGTLFVPVAPVDGQCGEHTVEQVMHQRQCCDGVPPIVWDYENSAEVIADDSSGIVVVTGGKSPYLWSVRGQGFYLDPACTKRDLVTSEPSVVLYTKDSCGTAAVYVTDTCSSVSEYVRSNVGQWVQIGQTGECVIGVLPCISHTADDLLDGINASNERQFFLVAQSGKYKITQTVYSPMSYMGGYEVGRNYQCNRSYLNGGPMCISIPLDLDWCSNPDVGIVGVLYYQNKYTVAYQWPNDAKTYEWVC